MAIQENTAKDSTEVKRYLIFDVINSKRKWNYHWILFFFVFLPSVIVIKLHFTFPGLFNDVFGGDEPLRIHRPVSVHVMKVFQEFDHNKDGVLTPVEFQNAFYDVKSGILSESAKLDNEELENFDLDVKSFLANQTFDATDKVLNLKASLVPMNLQTMKKFQDPSGGQDPQAQFHLHGITTWLEPNIEIANFVVSNFSVFLPYEKVTNLEVGSCWDLIPRVLGGLTTGGDVSHLAHFRYLPPKPTNDVEQLLLYLLSMLHKRPFLHMRFPPRGAIAMLRAFNEDYYDIMFRLHPEFQVNEPPRLPFWFTPASFIGRLVIKKDGSHIEHFEMSLPTHNKLNIDMEWITSEVPDDASKWKEQRRIQKLVTQFEGE